MAWLCKALSASGMPQYRKALQTVVDGAGDEKIRRYAKQALDTLP